MKRGRKPKPTRLELLQGNPGKRPIERDPVAPETKIPPCPAHLDAVARKEFTRVAAELHKLGMVSEVSMAALAVYAARPPISELCDPSGVIPRTARALAGRWFAAEAVRSGPCCSLRQY